MVIQRKTCPTCGQQLNHRLGEYECNCGYREPGTLPTEEAVRPTARQPDVSAPPSAPPQSSAVAFCHTARRDQGYDPAPTLGTEKMVLLGVFLAKAIVNILLVTLRTPNSTDVIFGPVVDQVGGELLNLGLLALVIFIPFRPLKWVCASLTCFYALVGLAGLILGAIFMPLLGFLATMMSPLGSGPSGTGLAFLGIIVSVINVLAQFWLASVLFRDLHKLQMK